MWLVITSKVVILIHFADRRQVSSLLLNVTSEIYGQVIYSMILTPRYWGIGSFFRDTLQWSEFIFCHKWDLLLTSHFSPPTLLRKSLPQIACYPPGGAFLRLWLMTVVLWLLFLVCHPTFLLDALFEKFVRTCSDSTVVVRRNGQWKVK